MEIIKQKYLSGERALFKSNNLKIEDSIFADGESPLKESKDIEINETIFKWKYPLWYCNDVKVTNSTLLETARSGIWYTKNISIIDSVIEGTKNISSSTKYLFRKCRFANSARNALELHGYCFKGSEGTW